MPAHRREPSAGRALLTSLALLQLALLAGCGREGADPSAGATGAGGVVAPRRPPLSAELRPAARALEERRFTEARALLERHLAQHPEDPQALFLLGLSHHWTENHGAARPLLERALALEPAFDLAHEPLAKSLLLLGELEAARREFELYATVAPLDPKGPYGLGLVALEEADLAAAEAHFRRALELFGTLERDDPRQAAARVGELSECHARLGDVHFARGELAQARGELLRATALSPGNVSAFYTLSLVHRRLGEKELADQAAARYEAARLALLAQQKGAR